jgi:hypothetical protein
MAIDDGFGNIIGRVAGKNYFQAGAPTQVSDLATSAERDFGYGRQTALTQDQDELQRMLMMRASGTGGPSVAEAQMQQGLNQAQAQTRGMAAGARGMNRIAAQRAAMATNANLAGQVVDQSAVLRANEQVAAQGLAAQNQGAMAGQNLALMQFGQGDQQALLEANLEAQRLNAQAAEGNAQRRGNLSTGIVQGVAGAVGGALLSDIRMKERITPIPVGATDERIRALLDDGTGAGPSDGMRELVARNARARDVETGRTPVNQLGLSAEQMAGIDARRALMTPAGSKRALAPVAPALYQYKPMAAAMMGTDTGQRAGVMAQDLEQSPLLADTVVDTPAGKAIDGQKAVSSTLALTAALDKRLKALEKGKRAA